MKKCPVCIDGRVLTKLSSAGAEEFCLDCRRITKSASFNFEFIASSPNINESVIECKGPKGEPGFKGPGDKARCWTYNNEEEKAAAHHKASVSAYAAQHKRAASKIVTSQAYFTGAPSSIMAPPTGAAQQAASMDNSDASTPVQATGAAQDFSGGQQTPLGQVTAPSGIQPGNLNSTNPLNSATTSSKRLAELINDDIRSHMGKSFCTDHMDYDGCNPDQNLQ